MLTVSLWDDLEDDLDLRYHRGVKPDVSIIAAIEEADGFKYSERHAYNPKTGGDGSRFNYVCQDSLQNKDRMANRKKKDNGQQHDVNPAKPKPDLTPTYDCCGAVHIKFSIKREAINVVYKHNPIHRDVESRLLNSDGDFSAPQTDSELASQTVKTTDGAAKGKRKRSKKDQGVAANGELHDPDLDMSTSPEAPKTSAKKKQKKSGTTAAPERNTGPSAKKSKKSKATATSPVKARKKASAEGPSPPLRLAKNKACIRCREKKIKCNEAKPSCNQCKRGLWTCHYETVIAEPTKRSRNGCINCKQRRRKCTEEKPYCAYCLKVDDDCEYAEYP
ncbi:hypothetical protein N0V94_008330 [Neodidymelliopsis sp. IMI 364377]|nr:hypothetical protein N0V94_008330 [Neodidymelliopsis sp. IMI 364377]